MDIIPGLAELRKLINLMEKSGSTYLKDRANYLDRYLAQLLNKEITRPEFNLMIENLIEVKKIDLSNNYESNEKKRQILNLAKQTIPKFNSPL